MNDKPGYVSTSMHMSGKMGGPSRSSLMDDIRQFHNKFGFNSFDKPDFLGEEETSFRLDFMDEELEELMTAYHDNDLEGMFDGMIDLVYVVLGTAHLMGLPFQEGWDRVHAANMTKVRGPSVRSGDFDVIKPEGFVKPDLSDLVK